MTVRLHCQIIFCVDNGFDFSAVTIGFEQTLFLAEEGDIVEVCARLLMGTLERDVEVVASSRDGSAEGM